MTEHAAATAAEGNCRLGAVSTPNELTAAIVQSLNVESMTLAARIKATDLDAAIAKSTETLQQVMTTLAKARTELGRAIASNEAKRFDDEAKAHGKAADHWLVASVAMAAITGLFALTAHWILAFFELTIGAVGGTQYVSSKVIVFVALLYPLFFADAVTRRHR